MKDKQNTATELFDAVKNQLYILEKDAVMMHKNSAYIKAVRKCINILCDEYNEIVGAKV